MFLWFCGQKLGKKPERKKSKNSPTDRCSLPFTLSQQDTSNWTYAFSQADFPRKIPISCGKNYPWIISFVCNNANSANGSKKSRFFSKNRAPCQKSRRVLAMFVFVICIWSRGEEQRMICIRKLSDWEFHAKKTLTFRSCHSWHCVRN